MQYYREREIQIQLKAFMHEALQGEQLLRFSLKGQVLICSTVGGTFINVKRYSTKTNREMMEVISFEESTIKQNNWLSGP